MNIILKQLGGKQFIVMTGVKNIVYDGDNNLRMNLPRNMSKANRLVISLQPTDTYKMTFSKFTPEKFNRKFFTWSESKDVIIKEFKNIYCDQLQEIFTQTTGMYTKLF